MRRTGAPRWCADGAGLDVLDGVNGVASAIRRRLLLGVLDDEVVSALRTFDRIEQSFQIDEPAEERTEI